MPTSSGYDIYKRFLDVGIALGLLVVFAPLMLLIGLLLAVAVGRPILFRQHRPGLRGKLFTLLKFRTMTPATSNERLLIPDSDRLNRFGRFLRATSLDELPEIINVLLGHMSIVGPRPLLAVYLSRYSPDQMRRHDVLPGITGWAQVNGRNNLSWDEKFTLDLWYIDHRSMWLDVKIMALTLRQLLRRDGIDHPGHVGAPEFTGSTPQRLNSVAEAKLSSPSHSELREHSL